jgi:hypothetical protein
MLCQGPEVSLSFKHTQTYSWDQKPLLMMKGGAKWQDLLQRQ